SEVQNMLIPKSLPHYDNYEISCIYKPHFNVGGDYFDYIKFGENRFAICIADISGKGVAAALLMANFQATIQSLIHQYRDLETFVFALNQSVHRITNSDKFITFFIAEFDLDKKEIKYINAGHYPPILRTGDTITKLDKGCTVIGAFDVLPDIKEETIKLEGESLILCFTDGLADLRNIHNDFFDIEAMDTFVEENHILSADDFNEKLINKIDMFKGEQEYTDDIAILTCKIY
ncbi:MAG: SpoIIE family protein phosphatase, partial [Melioribacteraceae bacterium]|nr:SpoIIE family protein phosphatase [Melioribacteraceae bacterium]